MFNQILIEPWWRFAAALLLGALLGLEREFIQQHTDSADLAGIRTFSLIALLGAVTAHLTPSAGVGFALLAFLGLMLLLSLSHFATVTRTQHEHGLTTEVAALLTFAFGAMVVWDRAEIAIALAVITALLLSLKGSLHAAIRRMSANDLRLTIEFGLVSAVVLPLLPNRTIDPWNVLNPFEIWLLVVLVSGIGFGGYILMHWLGASRGLNLTALLGGLVSSTATTISFSTRSRDTETLVPHLAQGIVLASSLMLPRVLVLVLVTHPALAQALLVPTGLMLLAAGAGVVLLRRTLTPTDTPADHELTLGNPLKLSTAITFGLVFAAILVALRLMIDAFGNTGVYIASGLAGLADVDAISLSLARLTGGGQIDLRVAAIAVLIAVVVNTAVKAAITVAFGHPNLRRPILRIFGLMLLAGLASIAYLWCCA